MFRKFKRDEEFQCPVVLDAHVTSPGQDEPVIIRNDLKTRSTEARAEIYERARVIYARARNMRSRSSGII